MNELKKTIYILGNYKYRLPFLGFLFFVISLIEVIGIGLIGPFVALLGYQENIINNYPFFNEVFGLTDNKSIVSFVGLALVLIFCSKGFVAYFVQKKILSLGYEIRTSIVEKLISSYQKTDYEDIASKKVSSVLVNTNTHVGLFIDSIFIPALRLSIEVIIIIGIFLLMALTNLLLVLTVAILLSVVILLYYKFIRVKLFYYGKIMSQKESSIISEIKQIIGAFREIRILGVEDFFRKEIKKDVDQYGEAGVITRSLYVISRYVVEASVVIFIVALVILMINQQQPIEYIFSVLSVFAVGALRLVPSFNAIGIGIANIRTAKYALNSVYDELKKIQEETALKKNKSNLILKNFESLDLIDVNYSYKSEKQLKVLSDINIKIKKGDFVAISGKSGSGKSTLMDIMTCMLKPSDGKLVINGQELKNFSKENLKDWFNKCTFIPQSVFLINKSIKNNIALGIEEKNIDFDKLDKAVKQANLGQVMEKNNMNLDSMVGENGIKLSGGQKQRVALARALYSERELIFMDEATSALDKETEDQVMSNIEILKGQVTLVIISHSSNALNSCNKVFKLEDGRIIN
tara:strand:- start:31249 stop:32979 length:1731 start_codon:yes stop_codon:yes gene_type:complete